MENSDIDFTIDESFERHLLQLYFAWHDPRLHVVNEEFAFNPVENIPADLDIYETTHYLQPLSHVQALYQTFRTRFNNAGKI